MKVVVMLRGEGGQHPDDGVPRVGAPGHDPVTADLAIEPIVRGANGGLLSFVDRRSGRYRGGIEDEHVLRERRGRQTDVYAGECLRCDSGAGLHHHFEPQTEAIGVELLVQAWLGRAPQVEIEDRRQLAGCRQRNELPAILESAVLNDAVKNLWWQSRDDVREVRRSQNPIEQRTRVSDGTLRRAVASPLRAATTSTMNGFGF